MKLKEKAWMANRQYFYEPWFAPEEVFYGETASKAKAKAWDSLKHDGYKDHLGEEITFLTLKLVRTRQFDKYEYKNEIRVLRQIERLKEIEERDNKLYKLVSENPTGFAYIKKRGAYYGPNSCGYTDFRVNAGVYTIQQAVTEVVGCDPTDNMDVILIDPEEHNKMIHDKIESLKSRIILMPENAPA